VYYNISIKKIANETLVVCAKEKLYVVIINEILIKSTCVVLIFGSSALYAFRTYTGKIRPSPSTWLLLTIISLSVFVSYFTSDGTKENIWIVLSDFIEPTIIFILIINKRRKILFSLTNQEKILLALTLTILAVWATMYSNTQDPNILRFTLYASILAEILALYPQAKKHVRKPDSDRPLPWIMSGFGYMLGILLIPEFTISNLLIPGMGTIYASMSIPLILYRIKQKKSLKEWI